MISRRGCWGFIHYGTFALTVVLAFSAGALAANLPCSGKKRGIAGCQGETFVCNDGSISGSKKSCSAYMGTVGLLGRASENMKQTPNGVCNCRDGAYCVGPRGGKFCRTDSGERVTYGSKCAGRNS